MKTKFAGILAILVLTGFVLSGCGCFQQQMKGETPPPIAPPAAVQAPEEKPVVVVAAPPPPPGMPAAPIVMLKDINFDFDKYNIRSGDAEVLRQNTDWFKTNPGKSIRIEGNCDERGTVEYNLALGQRRADSTKDFLVNLGIGRTLLTTVSYGKERSFCQEHNEECWAQNRRAHFEPIQ
jgi:peptidoglycan-associated lipoprotein